ncbi:MAG: hypothetical protein KGM98_00420, partial [Bacteroidota bacterium]|nr:hypothetical protein [Bacteroidota bacterium]
QISMQFLLASYKSGDSTLAAKVSDDLRKDLEQQITYYNSLNDNQQAVLSQENQTVQQLLEQLNAMEAYFKSPALENPELKSPIINNPKVNVKQKMPTDKTQ